MTGAGVSAAGTQLVAPTVSGAQRPFDAESQPVLELADVTKRFGTNPPLEVLRGISLCVDRGELAAIVGPSGSGKSTLLNIIGSLDRPSTGTVRVAGVDIATLDDRQLSAVRAHRIGFVFQGFFLLDGIDALDNVATGLLYTGAPLNERRRRAADVLERVGLEHRVHHRPAQLSGGERQRVAIARAIVHRPAVVLADEPTGNLDTAAGASIMTLVRQLNDEGATILVITHDRDLAASLPRQISIRDGLLEHDTGATRAR